LGDGVRVIVRTIKKITKVAGGAGTKLRDRSAKRRVFDIARAARMHRGETRSEDKLLSVFEPSTEIIRKGKSGKTND
jgi:hypothetical protein